MGCDGGEGRGAPLPPLDCPRAEGTKGGRKEEEGTVNLNLNRPLTQWGFGKEREEEFKGKGRTDTWGSLGQKSDPSSSVNQLNIGSVSLTESPEISRTFNYDIQTKQDSIILEHHFNFLSLGTPVHFDRETRPLWSIFSLG